MGIRAGVADSPLDKLARHHSPIALRPLGKRMICMRQLYPKYGIQSMVSKAVRSDQKNLCYSQNPSAAATSSNRRRN